MFLLDTNVISELRPRKGPPSPFVKNWAGHVSPRLLYVSAISILELEVGVLSMERKDWAQGERLRIWLQPVLAQFSSRTLPFTRTTALLCAPMHVPNRRSERDAIIAATAKEHGYTVVTRNVRDFQDCGVAVLNPWEDLKPN